MDTGLASIADGKKIDENFIKQHTENYVRNTHKSCAVFWEKNAVKTLSNLWPPTVSQLFIEFSNFDRHKNRF